MRPVLFLSTKPYFLRGAAINHWDHRWMRAASVRPTAPAFGFLRSESSFQQVHRVVKGSCSPARKGKICNPSKQAQVTIYVLRRRVLLYSNKSTFSIGCSPSPRHLCYSTQLAWGWEVRQAYTIGRPVSPPWKPTHRSHVGKGPPNS